MARAAGMRWHGHPEPNAVRWRAGCTRMGSTSLCLGLRVTVPSVHRHLPTSRDSSLVLSSSPSQHRTFYLHHAPVNALHPLEGRSRMARHVLSAGRIAKRFGLRTAKLLTAKYAKKSREGREEELRLFSATFANSLRSFRLNAFDFQSDSTSSGISAGRVGCPFFARVV